MFDRLKTLLSPPEIKSSRTARLVAFESGGRARWSPRDYPSLAREGYLANAIVHRSVRLIVENAAALSFLVFEGAQERDAHPLVQLLTRPNPRQDGAVFFEMLYAHLLLAGNAYIEAVALGAQVRELYALRPDRMKVVPGADGWAESYEYSVGGRSVRFDQLASPVAPILHLTFFHPLDDHYGLAPIEAAAIALDLRNLAVDNLAHLGINTTASSPNLLSVKSNAALLAAINAADGGSGDVRLQLSKESAAKTASVFFSDAFSGRAEFGLTGDDNFHLKVSPDGSAWVDALVIDKTTGKVTLQGFSNALTSRTQLAAAPIDALAFSGMQVNGAMEIAQENAASVVTLTATGSLQFKYLLDGVLAASRGSFVATGQQVAAPSGMPAVKALKISVTTAQASLGANDELTIMLPIEGLRTSRLLLGTALASPQSLGFWISAHRTGAYSGSIMNAAKTRSCPFSFTVAAADTPQWISLSGASAIPADTSGTWLNDSNVGAMIAICLAGGSSRVGTAGAWATTTSPGLVGVTGTSNGVGATSDLFYIGSVVALPGLELPPSDRAPYIMRPSDQESALCQRYFCCDFAAGTAPADNIQKNSNVAMAYAAGAFISPRLAFPVRMRATPAITPFSSNAKASPSAGQWQYFNGASWNDGTGTSGTGVSPDAFQIQLAGTATAQAAYLVAGSWKADARL
jgi:Phage portal protein